MKTRSLLGGRIDRCMLVSVVLLALGLLVGLGVLVAACGGTQTTATGASPTSTTQAATITGAAPTTTTTAVSIASTSTLPPTTSTSALVPMSKAGVAQWKTDVIAFYDRLVGASSDVDAWFAEFADDVTFYDPSNGDFVIKGKPALVAMQRDFLQSIPDMKIQMTGMYLSGDGVVYANAEEDMWPPWVLEPADHPPVDELAVFRFKDGKVASWDVWFSAPTLEMVTFGVFAPGKGGGEQIQKIADRYLTVWSSGDKAGIAALYHPEAVFSDTMLGLHTQGPAAISELSQKRFRSAGKVTFKIIDLYAQTNSYKPPTAELPGNGVIIGVGIHYSCDLVVDGQTKTVEGLITFELGTRQGKAFAPDPNGLITREEVFYEADSLLASGLVR